MSSPLDGSYMQRFAAAKAELVRAAAEAGDRLLPGDAPTRELLGAVDR